MSTSKQRKRRHPAAAGLLTVLALTGCGTQPDADPGSDPDPDPAASASATTPEASASPEPPKAANGTDYDVCHEGRCEVAVSEPVEFDFGEFTMTITAVTEDGIEYETTSPDGSSSSGGSISGGYCESYVTANSTSGSCFGIVAGSIPEANPAPRQLAIQLIDVTDGTAIIRLTMGS